MSVDVQHFADLMVYLHITWSAPLVIGLSIVFLYLIMGPSAFAGMGVLILMIPVNATVAVMIKKLQVRF